MKHQPPTVIPVPEDRWLNWKQAACVMIGSSLTIQRQLCELPLSSESMADYDISLTCLPQSYSLTFFTPIFSSQIFTGMSQENNSNSLKDWTYNHMHFVWSSGACHQAWWPKFYYWNPHGGRGEQISTSYLLTAMYVLWRIHTQSINKCNFKRTQKKLLIAKLTGES